MKIMADGKNHMIVRAIQYLRILALKPQLRVGGPALRTGSVLARVVHGYLVVAVGARIDMIALSFRAAGHDGPGCAQPALTQPLASAIVAKVI